MTTVEGARLDTSEGGNDETSESGTPARTTLGSTDSGEPIRKRARVPNEVGSVPGRIGRQWKRPDGSQSGAKA